MIPVLSGRAIKLTNQFKAGEGKVGEKGDRFHAIVFIDAPALIQLPLAIEPYLL